MKRVAPGSKESGAALIEFAMLMPLLVILLLGIIEFGWIFSQNNDVRHGAREGARMAAVNTADNTGLHPAICDSMDLTSGATVQLTDSANGLAGETGTVQIVATPGSLSGANMIEVFLPSTLTSTVEFRLEQPSGLWDTDVSPASC